MTKRVPFSQIKPGGFFRIKGKTLYQRGRGNSSIGQIVTGPKTGIGKFFNGDGFESNTPVTPVNAKIVEEQ